MYPVSHRIAVVDDERNILIGIETTLASDSYQVDCFNCTSKALAQLQGYVYDCLLLDIRIGDENGIDFFKKIRNLSINTPVIFMSGNASLDEAAKSQQLGAFDFLEKPFSAEKLKITVHNCLEFNRIQNQLDRLNVNQIFPRLIGEHPLILKLKQEIEKVSKTSAVVLIGGESGTGKELIAEQIHRLSQRSQQECIKVNCSAIPENLIESTLFGHTKGSFTGATSTKKGYFELAHKGTIFLDEIGDMPLSAQAKLLRVIETGEIQKIGAEVLTKIDVRVIAATHKNLHQAVLQQTFRQDLFYRLNIIPIESPPLRHRLSDIPLLVQHLLNTLCERHGIAKITIEKSCIEIFMQYDWPGNVRELNNILERMLIMGTGRLSPLDIPKEIQSTFDRLSLDVTLKEYRADCERYLIIDRLKYYSGNVSLVAKSLGIDRTNLHKKMKAYRIMRTHEFE